MHAITLDGDAATERAAAIAIDPPPDDAWSSIFDTHHERVFTAAFRITGNVADAEDALQTVFLRFLRRADRQDEDRVVDVGAFLCRSAINAGLDIVRRRQREVSAEAAIASATNPSDRPDDTHYENELVDALRSGLATMDGRQAEVVALHYLEGFSNRDIAEILQTSSSTIAVTLHRARARLKDYLAPLAPDLFSHHTKNGDMA